MQIREILPVSGARALIRQGMAKGIVCISKPGINF